MAVNERKKPLNSNKQSNSVPGDNKPQTSTKE